MVGGWVALLAKIPAKGSTSKAHTVFVPGTRFDKLTNQSTAVYLNPMKMVSSTLKIGDPMRNRYLTSRAFRLLSVVL